MCGFHFNWEKAKAWQLLANEKNSPVDWSWDCSFKLDYDGNILKVSSRFYPPCEQYGDNWGGTVMLCYLDKELISKKFVCGSLDILKHDVEKYVTDLLKEFEIMFENHFKEAVSKRTPDPNGVLKLTPEELREYKEKFMTPTFQTDFIGVRMDDVGDACVIFKHQYTRDEMGYKIANTKEFLWLAERFELEVK